MSLESDKFDAVAQDFLEMVKTKNVFLYGAGWEAADAIMLFEMLGYKNKISCCMVTNTSGNYNELLGIPVREVSSAEKENEGSCVVLVATIPCYYQEITATLNEYNYTDIFYYFDVRAQLGNFAFKKYTEKRLKEIQLKYLTDGRR